MVFELVVCDRGELFEEQFYDAGEEGGGEEGGGGEEVTLKCGEGK